MAHEGTSIIECYSRNPAVVIPYGICNAGLLDSIDHLLCFPNCSCQWFFYKNHFPGGCGSHCYFSMSVIWCTDINCINVFSCYKLFPVCFKRFISPLLCETFCLAFISCST